MAGTDKLTAPLLGRPLLAWTVAALRAASAVRRLVVVAAADRLEELRAADWLREIDPDLTLVAGGEQRADSVSNGVHAIDADLVLVHDGARPLVTPQLVDAVVHAAAREGAAIPVMAVADSLRRLDGEWVVGLVDREGLAAAQTPQAARRDLLLDAFAAAPAGSGFTDEAALLAANGVPVVTVPGEPANLKVTRPADLELAAAILAARHLAPASERRTGFGQDSHPFGPQLGLWLGGVLLDAAPRLYGHSDGDVALHALATAILAGARLGDLGRHFPPTDGATAGAPSAELLAAVVAQAQAAGWRVESAQISLLGARPRLGAARLDAMRDRVAQLLALEPAAVAIVASGGNLAGPEGAGLVISASAIATLVAR